MKAEQQKIELTVLFLQRSDAAKHRLGVGIQLLNADTIDTAGAYWTCGTRKIFPSYRHAFLRCVSHPIDVYNFGL
jgi:hypothetical protein